MEPNDYYTNNSYGYPQNNGVNPQEPQPQGSDGSQPDFTRQPNGMSVASMILGIASVALLCCGGFGLPLGIMGLIFALLSRRGRHMNTQAKVGMGLSLGGIGLAIIVTAVQLIIMFSSGAMSQLMHLMQKYDITTQSGAQDFLEEWDDYLYGIPSDEGEPKQTPDSEAPGRMPDTTIPVPDHSPNITIPDPGQPGIGGESVSPPI